MLSDTDDDEMSSTSAWFVLSIVAQRLAIVCLGHIKVALPEGMTQSSNRMTTTGHASLSDLNA